MSLYITAINSGSNGNCYYVGNQEEAVLIDVGISCNAVEKRLALLGLPLRNVKAIFVTHEHKDHTKGVSTLANKYAHQPIGIGELTITAFKKCHDASDPHSFIVSCNGVTVGVFTDHGMVCDHTIHYFKSCHAAFLESNYDEEMLKNGPYSEALKTRISSGQGHLSNVQALELFKLHRPPFMSHLVLSHLCSRNNTPEIVSEMFLPHAGNTQIIVASRDVATAVFNIKG